ncbi:MAG: hypothetical protein A3F09_04445 [Chlamydiae bacterium RIFCSPHIGHO2_12_FULL_49_11]|nr:MAG: hypothetical protein A3F09_04445 [Chlamydiae bacterium RIFCSPHIGHO2_12_FULL_49_11]
MPIPIIMFWLRNAMAYPLDNSMETCHYFSEMILFVTSSQNMIMGIGMIWRMKKKRINMTNMIEEKLDD